MTTPFKYLQVFQTSFTNTLTYRASLVMWRLRSVIRLGTYLLLWSAVLQSKTHLFGYDRSDLFTYLLGTALLRTLVMQSLSYDMAGEISSGDLSNYLLKPISYLNYWVSRDLAHKILNGIFSIIEVGVVILLFQLQAEAVQSLSNLLAFIICVILAGWLFFYLSALISMTTFWYLEHQGWPQRFVFDILIEFFAGAMFPLDILPPLLYQWLRWLPTSYLLYFPMQVWLGKVGGMELVISLVVMVAWILILRKLVGKVWQKGLVVYEASGR